MLKWGKSSLSGSNWKHRYSFSTSELEYKFNRNLYKKMDDSHNITTRSIEGNEDNLINDNNFSNNGLKDRRKWLSVPVTQNNRRCSVNDIGRISESIKEIDVMEWKKYVKYELKDNEYINLNINGLLKEFLNKNKMNKNDSTENNNSLPSNGPSELYSDKIIDLNAQEDNPIFENFINDNSVTSTISNKNINYSQNNSKQSSKTTPMDYDIQTIEYNLKYNSSYEVENIPENVIIDLLNNQLQSEEPSSSDNMVFDTTTTTNININAKTDFTISSTDIPSQKSPSLPAHMTESSKLLKHNSNAFTSEPTTNINIPQTIPTDRQNNNWNMLYVISEVSKLSNSSNYTDSYTADVKRNHSIQNNNNNVYDYSNTTNTSADYHQFYLDNCPPSPPMKRRRRSLKDVFKSSYKQLYNSMKIKTKRYSTTILETGPSSFNLEENNTAAYTDIITFNDALNLPIEVNFK